MQTIEVLAPVILKAALFMPAASLFIYLSYQEVWVPIRDLHDNYARFNEVPNKSRRDHVQFWLWGKMPAKRTHAFFRDRDAA